MIVDKVQKERLKKLGINIKIKYETDDGIKERNSDNFLEQNIKEGIIIEKDYYYKGNMIKKITNFDSRIIYSFIFNNKEKVKCPNCGNINDITNDNQGCLYCGTNYNIDYNYKDLGSKYYYDYVMSNGWYKLIIFIIDFIFSFTISYIYIKETSRTFTIFDISKVLIGTILIGLILYFIFYYLDAAIILPFIKKNKERENQKQREFWKRMKNKGIDKRTFYNNLNYDLRCYYYGESNTDVIDYDIIDYISLEDVSNQDDFIIKVNLKIRLVRNIDNKIVIKEKKYDYYFKKALVTGSTREEINVIKCPGCGASIDVTRDKCEYCGRKINYLQEWYLVDIK